MQIRVTCPECGKSFQIPERFAGREGECSKCQAIFHIPRKAERAPEAKRKARPAAPGTDGSGATGRVSRPVQDAGVTEEIAVYSIEPSDEFEPAAPAPAAPPEPPVFDITDADLLPDDEDLSDDACPPRPPDMVFVDAEEDVSEDLPAIDARHAAPPARPRKRRSREADDAQKTTRRRPQKKAASDEASDDEPADLTAFVNADSGDDGAASDTAIPVIRRRRSGEEHSDSELPSRRSNPSKAKPPADDDESPSRRSRGKSNPRQLAILGGAGAVVLLGAFLYSHFSANTAPSLPVVPDAPAPPTETPPSADENPTDETASNETPSEVTAIAEPEEPDDKAATETPETSQD